MATARKKPGKKIARRAVAKAKLKKRAATKVKAKSKRAVATKRVRHAKKRAPKKRIAPKTRVAPKRRAVAKVVAHVPVERPLTDEEREAMARVAAMTERALGSIADGAVPVDIVRRIGIFIEEVRTGRRAEPKSQDLRLGLGVLWGEQVRAQVGWRWVHLTYPDGFASYALVSEDRAFACFPLNRLAESMKHGSAIANTSAHLFGKILSSELPVRRDNAYLVIG